MPGKKQDIVMYGFWGYDLFPFVVGGEITNPHKAEALYGLGYWEWSDTGTYIKPHTIMTQEAGKRVHAAIQGVAFNHRKQVESMVERDFALIKQMLAGAKLPGVKDG